MARPENEIQSGVLPFVARNDDAGTVVRDSSLTGDLYGFSSIALFYRGCLVWRKGGVLA
jgi:hypothetical protein